MYKLSLKGLLDEFIAPLRYRCELECGHRV